MTESTIHNIISLRNTPRRHAKAMSIEAMNTYRLWLVTQSVFPQPSSCSQGPPYEYDCQCHQGSYSAPLLEGVLVSGLQALDPVCLEIHAMFLYAKSSHSNFEIVQLTWQDLDWNHQLPHGLRHVRVDLQNRKGWQHRASSDERGGEDLRGVCTPMFCFAQAVLILRAQCKDIITTYTPTPTIPPLMHTTTFSTGKIGMSKS